MLTLQYAITSDHPCQIPVIGEFEAGETKQVDATTLRLFEISFGYKLGAARFAPSVRLTVTMTEESETAPEGTEEV